MPVSTIVVCLQLLHQVNPAFLSRKFTSRINSAGRSLKFTEVGAHTIKVIQTHTQQTCISGSHIEFLLVTAVLFLFRARPGIAERFLLSYCSLNAASSCANMSKGDSSVLEEKHQHLDLIHELTN